MADNTSTTQHITALDFDVSKAEKQLQELADKVDTISKEIASKNWTIKAVIEGDEELNKLQDEIDKAANELKKINEEAEKAKKGIDDMAIGGQESVSMLISSIETGLVNALESASRAAVESMKTVEDSMMEISRVLNLNGTATDEMRDKMFALGEAYGRSFDEVADVTLRYAQAGNNMTDSLTLAEQSLLAVNTAELDVEDATQSLIGIMAQWGYEADELSGIIDKLNYTADTNAITTQDLVDGLLKASSMAKTAGMSFDDTVGALTAMKVASGAAGKEVGNAFKSILAYIQRPESLKLFDSMGIEVYADKATGALMPMMDILQQMSEKWNAGEEAQNKMIDTLVQSGDAAQMLSEEWATATDTLDEYNAYLEAQAKAQDKANDAESRAQAQAAAGVFRRNYYIALMENWNKALDVSRNMQEAEGHSMQENSRYMETLTAKIEQLKVALAELAVSLADAGFMDAAKAALETATAIVKWTTETKSLVPILATVASLLVTIKATKIASEFSAIGSSIASAGKAIGSVFTGATAAVEGTATAATAASAAIGGVGLAIAALAAVVGVFFAVQEELRKVRLEAIATGDAALEETNSLRELQTRYEELADVTHRTAEQEEEFQDVTDSIVGILGNKAEALHGLTRGTKEYNEVLEKLIETEMRRNAVDMKIGAENAVKEAKSEKYNKTFDLKDYGDVGAQYLYSLPQFNGWDSNWTDMSGDTFQDFKKISDAYNALNDEIDRYTEAKDVDSAAALKSSETYKQLEKQYNLMFPAIEKAVQAEKDYQEQMYILEHGIPQTYDEQREMNEAIIESSRVTEDYKDMLGGMITQYYSTSDAKKDFDKAMQSDDFEAANNQLKVLAESGRLTEASFEKNQGIVTKLSPLMKSLGLNAKDVVGYYNALYGSSQDVGDATGDLNLAIGMTDDEFKQLSKDISDSEKSISSLNGYMQTLREGGALTAEQVLNLCDTYGLLMEQFTETEKGYTIETSALETLRQAHIDAAIAARQQQIEQTQAIQSGLIARLQAYGLEVEGIQSVADAEKALTDLRNNKAEDAKGINGAADAQGFNQKYANYNADIEAIENIKSAYENLENLASGVYEHLGEKAESSSAKTQDSTKKEIDLLKQKTEELNHMAEVGGYSLEQLIGSFEYLKRTMELSEEQMRDLEETLDKLYEQQTKEYLSEMEDEYKKYLDDLKEMYDEQADAYKDELDEEYDALKEKLDKEYKDRKKALDDEIDNLKSSLNAQIKNAKTAYEQKKKLANDGSKAQIEALKAARDAEIKNIEDTYNAQIDALNKIKKAREQARDEEDYQDERDELLEQIDYWEQRTGTEAVENLESLKKQLAELDKNREREREDTETQNQIDALKEEMDARTDAIKSMYDAQIAAAQMAASSELSMYEQTYNAEVAALQNRLDTEVKALEDKRDKELEKLKAENDKKLKEEKKLNEQKLKDFKKEKEDELEAEKDKWEQIKKMFTDANLDLVAGAHQFAPQMYQAFMNAFTNPMKTDLATLQAAFAELQNAQSTILGNMGTNMLGTLPTQDISGTSTFQNGTSNSNQQSSSSQTEQDMRRRRAATARTGGLTTADGLVMLHQNELIVNPEQTRNLEQFFDDYTRNIRPVMMSREILDGIRDLSRMFNSSNVTNNNSTTFNNSNTYDNGRKVEININAPLQNIENVGDEADARVAANNVERMLQQQINRMY